MNEQYLFRGKRYDNGKWVLGSAFYDSDKQRHYIITDIIDSSKIVRGCKSENVTLHWVDSATVGQCTGLRDKNGKLIFEGDVIKQDEEKQVCGAITLVYWDEKYGGWFASLRSPERPSEINEVLPLTEVNEFEYVCGNIHDNPELLNN